MTGSDFGSAFAGLAFVFVAGLVAIPLGLWKLIEIVIWIYQHIHISFL